MREGDTGHMLAWDKMPVFAVAVARCGLRREVSVSDKRLQFLAACSSRAGKKPPINTPATRACCLVVCMVRPRVGLARREPYFVSKYPVLYCCSLPTRASGKLKWLGVALCPAGKTRHLSKMGHRLPPESSRGKDSSSPQSSLLLSVLPDRSRTYVAFLVEHNMSDEPTLLVTKRRTQVAHPYHNESNTVDRSPGARVQYGALFPFLVVQRTGIHVTVVLLLAADEDVLDSSIGRWRVWTPAVGLSFLVTLAAH